MGMTMTQKILAAHAGLPEVKAGQLIRAKLDMVLGNDITSPVAIREFEKEGFTGVFDKSKISMVMDHFTPNKDIKAAEQCLQCRTFARQFDLDNFYDVGQMGVEHALLPEKGLVAAGECIIGADSHTCTYGALGAFSTGVGSTDMAAGMATDVILHLIGLIGVDGALYQSLEYCGDGVAALSMDDRLCIANMSIEAGAKNGIFPVDAITRAYLDGRVNRPYTAYEADPDAEYVRTVEIDLSQIEPTVAFPHLPENAHPISQVGQIKIDQVVIGSCTNGRLEDMAVAAKLLEGKKVADHVRCIVMPATQHIFQQCIDLGYLSTFISAGCAVSTPTCGPCLGGHMGVMANGEKCVATTNRNFVGRCRRLRRGRLHRGPAELRPGRNHFMLNAKGFVHKYGDNVDTDVIIPARYLNIADKKELATHCMEDIDKNFVHAVKAGDVMVGGFNFGCGSSREHAPMVIKESGISCVIAKTFARIFYRNAINIGLAILECPEASEKIEAGDEVSIDFDTGLITNATKGETYQANPFPDFIKEIIQAGGLMADIKKRQEG